MTGKISNRKRDKRCKYAIYRRDNPHSQKKSYKKFKFSSSQENKHYVLAMLSYFTYFRLTKLKRPLILITGVDVGERVI